MDQDIQTDAINMVNTGYKTHVKTQHKNRNYKVYFQ